MPSAFAVLAAGIFPSWDLLTDVHDFQQVHRRLNNRVDVPIPAYILVVTEHLPKRLGLHRVPRAGRIASRVGVIPVALKQTVSKAIPLSAGRIVLHLLQPLDLLALRGTQGVDFCLQLLLDPQTLCAVLRVLAYGVKGGFELLVLLLTCLIPAYQVL